MPPCPSSGSVPVQRMFWLVATLQVVGAPSTFTRKVPSGPPAWGQLAPSPPDGAGGTMVLASACGPPVPGVPESAAPETPASFGPGALPAAPPVGDSPPPGEPPAPVPGAPPVPVAPPGEGAWALPHAVPRRAAPAKQSRARAAGDNIAERSSYRE